MKALKKEIFFILLFMVIGIAVVTTNVVGNMSTSINQNPDDFLVYFSDVKVDGTQDLSLVRSEKELVFNGEFSAVGDKKIGVSNSFDTSNMSARSTRTGTLIVKKLKSNSAQSDTVYSITCSIVAQSIDREDVGTGEVQGPYKLITFTYDGVVYNAVEG